MKTEQTFFFEYNVPAGNNWCDRPDSYIDVVAKRHAQGLVIVTPVIHHNFDLRKVRDWNKALNEIQKIADDHFNSLTEPEADLALQEHLS